MAKFFLVNSGFELGDRDWAKGTGFNIEMDAVNSRSGSWLSRFNGTASDSLLSIVKHPVRPGGKISFGIYVDGEDATAGVCEARLSYEDINDVFVSGEFGANSVNFGQAGYLITNMLDSIAPDRAKAVQFFIRMHTTPAGTWYLDDATLTGDIIESIPTTAIIASHRMVPADTIGVFDPLIGQDKFTEFNAGMSDKWSFVYTFIPALGADLGELVSFIRRLGRNERFFAFDPDRTIPLNGIVNGMTVDGPITNGTNKISVKAGPVSTTALVAGDYIEVRDQYFQLQRDLEIGPEGSGEAIVWPSVRSTFADGEDIITDNPKMVARITSDLDWRRVQARPVEITISGEEV